MYTPRKELGQNFLMDRKVVSKMVDALELRENDVVVEIGPGLGVITRELADRIEASGLTVHAVEIDVRFVERLKNMFLEDMGVDIVEADILKWLPQFDPGKPFKLIGSLPYYITSPIIHSIIKMKDLPQICVLLIQKEVAEKTMSTAPDSSYLSVFVQSFYEVSYFGKVERGKFSPIPEVDGGILRFKKRETSFIEKSNITAYEGFLHKGFSHPRKMINKVFSKEELEKIGVEGNLRPQNLDADTWAKAFLTLTGR